MPRQAGLSILLSFTLIALVAAGLAGQGGVGPGKPTSNLTARGRPEPIVAAGTRTSSQSADEPDPTVRTVTLVPTRPSALPAPSAGEPWPVATPPTADPIRHRDWISSSGPFTVVRAGESVAAVAFRVYGDPAAAEHLLAANRDQMLSPTTPLRPGQPLRTP